MVRCQVLTPPTFPLYYIWIRTHHSKPQASPNVTARQKWVCVSPEWEDCNNYGVTSAGTIRPLCDIQLLGLMVELRLGEERAGLGWGEQWAHHWIAGFVCTHTHTVESAGAQSLDLLACCLRLLAAWDTCASTSNLSFGFLCFHKRSGFSLGSINWVLYCRFLAFFLWRTTALHIICDVSSVLVPLLLRCVFCAFMVVSPAAALSPGCDSPASMHVSSWQTCVSTGVTQHNTMNSYIGAHSAPGSLLCK